nr:ABC transporter B family member 10 [Tanacetum cinerariifolium]
PAVGLVPAKIAGDIRYEHVAFRYPTRPDVPVLQDIDFHIAAGEKIALVGPSGAGKSTIAGLLMQFYPLSGGRIVVDGHNVADYDLTALRSHIGIVPQETLLFGGTIRDNIAYGKPDATDQEIIEAAQRANAWQFISAFPESLDTVVGDRGIKLSGGQRQRVAIARAILKNPAILILDEATSSLDSESEKLVQGALDELMQNRTSLIIAHRLSTIRKVDKILVIDGGRIVEAGSHEELSEREGGLYANLLRLQFELAVAVGALAACQDKGAASSAGAIITPTTGTPALQVDAATVYATPGGQQVPSSEAVSPPAKVPADATKPIELEAWKSDMDLKSAPTPTPLPPEQRVGYALVGLGHLTLEEILPAFGACKKSKPVALV